jgi:transcriptional regulator with XRE-family HTH domain
MAAGIRQQDLAPVLGATEESLRHWELDQHEPEARFLPAIIRWLGYNPLPEPRTRGGAIRRERMSRGLSMRELAIAAGVDEETLAGVEADRPRMFLQPIFTILSFLGMVWPNKGN